MSGLRIGDQYREPLKPAFLTPGRREAAEGPVWQGARREAPASVLLSTLEEADRAQHRVQTGYMGNRIDREHG